MEPKTWTFTIDGLQIELPILHADGEMLIATAEALGQEQRDLIAEAVVGHIHKMVDKLRRAADAS